MSAGQTGHMTGQMGHVHGTDGTHTRACPAKVLYVYCFFPQKVIVNYQAVVFFTTPAYLLRREPFFERKSICKSKENGVRTRRAAIVNHSPTLNSLRIFYYV